ncbi:MAG: DUF4102 domain-containing protein [Pseudomonas sp.]|nr:MAG: DUF4102 domain-containing protein [Pseudomonas sp.]
MLRSEIKRRPLADTVLSTLEPDAKEYRELDGNGLYFRVKPDGGKSWQLRYKNFEGKWSWLGIGGYPEVGGALARKKAAELRNTISQGIDPLAQRRAEKAAQEAANARLFRITAEDWLAFKQSKGLSEGTLRQVRTYLDKDILPALGDKSLDSITRSDCEALQQSLEQREAHNIAEKCRSWVNQIFGYAIAKGLTENDPASRLLAIAAKAPETKQYPHLLEPELPDFLRALRASTSRLPARTAAWLCIWTASRPGMVRWAEWSEIDLDAATWTTPAAKMKMRRDYISPLPSQAVEALRELRRVTGSSRWLFPGIGSTNPTISENTINKVFASIGYKGRMVGHGSRHTFSTMANEHKAAQGFDKDMIEAQLAHKEQGVAGVYNNAAYVLLRRGMMQWYADRLDQLAQGNVVEFKRA